MHNTSINCKVLVHMPYKTNSNKVVTYLGVRMAVTLEGGWLVREYRSVDIVLFLDLGTGYMSVFSLIVHWAMLLWFSALLRKCYYTNELLTKCLQKPSKPNHVPYCLVAYQPRCLLYQTEPLPMAISQGCEKELR